MGARALHAASVSLPEPQKFVLCWLQAYYKASPFNVSASVFYINEPESKGGSLVRLCSSRTLGYLPFIAQRRLLLLCLSHVIKNQLVLLRVCAAKSSDHMQEIRLGSGLELGADWRGGKAASSVWREPGEETKAARNSDRPVKCSHTVVWSCLKLHPSASLFPTQPLPES